MNKKQSKEQEKEYQKQYRRRNIEKIRQNEKRYWSLPVNKESVKALRNT